MLVKKAMFVERGQKAGTLKTAKALEKAMESLTDRTKEPKGWYADIISLLVDDDGNSKIHGSDKGKINKFLDIMKMQTAQGQRLHFWGQFLDSTGRSLISELSTFSNLTQFNPYLPSQVAAVPDTSSKETIRTAPLLFPIDQVIQCKELCLKIQELAEDYTYAMVSVCNTLHFWLKMTTSKMLLLWSVKTQCCLLQLNQKKSLSCLQ